MREIRQSGSEGGGGESRSLPLSRGTSCRIPAASFKISGDSSSTSHKPVDEKEQDCAED